MLDPLWAREEETLSSPGSFCVRGFLKLIVSDLPSSSLCQGCGDQPGALFTSQMVSTHMPAAAWHPLSSWGKDICDPSHKPCLLLHTLQRAILLPACCAGKQEGKHRLHTNFAYLLSFKNLSKLPFCGSSAIVIQQWLENLFKTTPLAVQVSSDHWIMKPWKTKAQFRHESFTFMFEKK